MPGIVEWDRTRWSAEEWRRIDQPPVFLREFGAGDEVLGLSGEFVTTLGIFGTSPTAASDFILALAEALCEHSTQTSLDLDLASRAGLRTDELKGLLTALERLGRARQRDDGGWVASLPCDSSIRDWVGLLVGSNLDYRFDFGGARLVERDSTIVLIAGTPEVVSGAQALVERVARDTDTELKPLGWDADEC